MRGALPVLFAVTDDRVVARGGLPERAAAMAAAGGERLAIYLRARALGGAALLDLARGTAETIGPHGSWLAVGERADVARAARAQAVVSGRGALALQDVRRVAPAAAAGRSVHDDEEIRSAAAEGADFLIAGAVHATPSHPGVPGAGLGLIRSAASSGRPALAIGGMTPERTPDAVAAGAHGVAAIRALWDADDPAAAVEAFLAALPARAAIGVMVNGEHRSARPGITLVEFLRELGLDERALVVERNRRIVRREALSSTVLDDGDALELVHFVGGG